jgi:hypothetical protein
MKQALEHIDNTYLFSMLTEKFLWIQQRDAIQASQEEITDQRVAAYHQCEDE